MAKKEKKSKSKSKQGLKLDYSNCDFSRYVYQSFFHVRNTYDILSEVRFLYTSESIFFIYSKRRKSRRKGRGKEGRT